MTLPPAPDATSVTPAGAELTITYRSVRARIVVNRHGDRWRAHLQRKWKDGKAYSEWEPLTLLVLDDTTPTFPARDAAIMAVVLSVVEWEDERRAHGDPDDSAA